MRVERVVLEDKRGGIVRRGREEGGAGGRGRHTRSWK